MASSRNEEGITATVEGLERLKIAFSGIPDKLRRKVLLSALRKGAAVVRKAARAATPELAKPTPYRTKGLLKKRLMVRVSRASKAAGHVGVFVNVRPAKQGNRGAKNPNDPFYWRFIEFGTKPRRKGERSQSIVRGRLKTRRHRTNTGATKAYKFLQRGADMLPQALEIFEREIGPAIQKFDTP